MKYIYIVLLTVFHFGKTCSNKIIVPFRFNTGIIFLFKFFFINFLLKCFDLKNIFIETSNQYNTDNIFIIHIKCL